MLSISQLAARFELSRSTLLYYERIGLLLPSGRSPAGYRQYSAADQSRLERIVQYRDAGIPLADIGALLDDNRARWAGILERRLQRIQQEISGLRQQQQLIVRMLQPEGGISPHHPVSKAAWVTLLRDCGMTDEDMWDWHRRFEQRMPRGHQEFLESLGLDEAEIRAIRNQSATRAE